MQSIGPSASCSLPAHHSPLPACCVVGSLGSLPVLISPCCSDFTAYLGMVPPPVASAYYVNDQIALYNKNA